MFKNREPHFDGDYFFKDEAIAASEKVSDAFRLGNTQSGLRVRGWVEGTAASTAGGTISVTLEVGDESAADGTWEVIAADTATATGTTITGDIFSYVPDTDKKFMRVKVKGVAGITGTFSVAPEYVAR